MILNSHSTQPPDTACDVVPWLSTLGTLVQSNWHVMLLIINYTDHSCDIYSSQHPHTYCHDMLAQQLSAESCNIRLVNSYTHLDMYRRPNPHIWPPIHQLLAISTNQYNWDCLYRSAIAKLSTVWSTQQLSLLRLRGTPLLTPANCDWHQITTAAYKQHLTMCSNHSRAIGWGTRYIKDVA